MCYAFTSRFAFWLRTYLINQYAILWYCSSNLCKWHYLYGALPFFKIQANPFMAQDEPFGAKITPKYILWVRGLVPFWVLRQSFLSLTGCWWLYNIQLKTSRGYSFCPLLMPMSEAFSISFNTLYFVTQKLWAIKPRLWPQIEFFSSGGQESRRHNSTTTFQDSPGKNTGVGCHALLQGIFWTQG